MTFLNCLLATICNAYSLYSWLRYDVLRRLKLLFYLDCCICGMQNILYVLKYPDIALVLPAVMHKEEVVEEKRRRCLIVGFTVAIMAFVFA